MNRFWIRSEKVLPDGTSLWYSIPRPTNPEVLEELKRNNMRPILNPKKKKSVYGF